jgi:hypothetical protein
LGGFYLHVAAGPESMAGMTRVHVVDILSVFIDLSLIVGLLLLILTPTEKRARKKKLIWALVILGTILLILSVSRVISN